MQGAGLNVSFVGVEKLEVDALEGDDHFFVLSTNPRLVTTLIGGEGIDTFVFRDGLIQSPADIFRISVEELLKRERWAEVSARNLVAASDPRPQPPRHRQLFGLGLPQVGAVTARDPAPSVGPPIASAPASRTTGSNARATKPAPEPTSPTPPTPGPPSSPRRSTSSPTGR